MEENNTQETILDTEQLQNLLSDESMQPIELDVENLKEIQFDEKKFQKGIENMSTICGELTSLINIGISPQDAISYQINKETISYQKDLAKINNKAQLDITQATNHIVEKQSL